MGFEPIQGYIYSLPLEELNSYAYTNSAIDA